MLLKEQGQWGFLTRYSGFYLSFWLYININLASNLCTPVIMFMLTVLLIVIINAGKFAR